MRLVDTLATQQALEQGHGCVHEEYPPSISHIQMATELCLAAASASTAMTYPR